MPLKHAVIFSIFKRRGSGIRRWQFPWRVHRRHSTQRWRFLIRERGVPGWSKFGERPRSSTVRLRVRRPLPGGEPPFIELPPFIFRSEFRRDKIPGSRFPSVSPVVLMSIRSKCSPFVVGCRDDGREMLFRGGGRGPGGSSDSPSRTEASDLFILPLGSFLSFSCWFTPSNFGVWRTLTRLPRGVILTRLPARFGRIGGISSLNEGMVR